MPYQCTDSHWESVSARPATEGSIITDHASSRPARQNPRPACALLREERRAKRSRRKNWGRRISFCPTLCPFPHTVAAQTALSSLPCWRGEKSDAATTQQEWQDAQTQESKRGGFGNGCGSDSDIPEDRCPGVVRIGGIVLDL